ncbi:hypothetical protein WR25_05323 [Diploscapter pachys]|uniref:Telomerase reverse transcriptase n=1 Tax=Diploscapter pachys TaxID=2018661 RepID=A0A2A2M1I8_9BILA|nr:hypothetical protein WR25_05323 [Diploscapter pachys]
MNEYKKKRFTKDALHIWCNWNIDLQKIRSSTHSKQNRYLRIHETRAKRLNSIAMAKRIFGKEITEKLNDICKDQILQISIKYLTFAGIGDLLIGPENVIHVSQYCTTKFWDFVQSGAKTANNNQMQPDENINEMFWTELNILKCEICRLLMKRAVSRSATHPTLQWLIPVVFQRLVKYAANSLCNFLFIHIKPVKLFEDPPTRELYLSSGFKKVRDCARIEFIEEYSVVEHNLRPNDHPLKFILRAQKKGFRPIFSMKRLDRQDLRSYYNMKDKFKTVCAILRFALFTEGIRIDGSFKRSIRNLVAQLRQEKHKWYFMNIDIIHCFAQVNHEKVKQYIKKIFEKYSHFIVANGWVIHKEKRYKFLRCEAATDNATASDRFYQRFAHRNDYIVPKPRLFTHNKENVVKIITEAIDNYIINLHLFEADCLPELRDDRVKFCRYVDDYLIASTDQSLLAKIYKTFGQNEYGIDAHREKRRFSFKMEGQEFVNDLPTNILKWCGHLVNADDLSITNYMQFKRQTRKRKLKESQQF